MELVTGPDSAGTAVPAVVAPSPVSTELRTTGADDTRRLAGVMATVCIPGDVVLLVGDLGAGKTTFAQGFAAGLGVPEPVTSPTFTLVRQYAVGPLASPTAAPDQQGSAQPIRTLIHADVYRLDHLNEIVDLGLGELVEDNAVALVEWGDVAEPILGDGSLAIGLTPGPDDGDSERVITVSPRGDTWTNRWELMVEVLAPWRSEE
jgi:tRNA threonylcarbamoyladenosine biosynthesis protein TsaE